MRVPARFSAALTMLVLAVPACTGGEDPATTSPVPTPSSSVSQLPEGPVRFVPGEYRIDLSGVAVTLSWQDDAATMAVTNDSSETLGAPGVTAITNQPESVEASVDGPQTIPVGGSAEYTVVFPGDLTIEQTGLLLLSFGGDSWGAFSPVVDEG